MLFSSWLRKRTAKHQSNARPRATFRPQLEALGERLVPTTWIVTSPLDDGSAGTLRADINAALSGDTIVFAPTVGPRITLQNSELSISKSLTITGPGASQLAIDGGGYRIFDIAANTNVTISGLTISGGGGYDNNGFDGMEGDGGGIRNYGTLTLHGCTLTGNSVLYHPGGAIANFGTLTVDGCSITGNSASTGGGIYNAKHARLTVTGGSTFLNNIGGDIANYGQEHISKDSIVG